MVRRVYCATLVLCLGASWAVAGPEALKPDKVVHSFGTLSTLPASDAKAQAEAWLKGSGKSDEATKKSLDDIWGDEDRSVLDRVTDSLMLGSPEAKKMMTEARDPKTSAPTEVPAILKDNKIHPFLRANLALAYAKALSERRIYEESRECLMAVKAEQVVDPAQYLFLKAVAEHALIMKKEAADSIVRLLEDVSDSPERYTTVAALMIIDMELWKDKDLGWIERKMGNIERRLDLARGGKKTQEIERQVVMRLDELIKEKENQQNQQSNGGCWPSGGSQPGGSPSSVIRPSSPQKDSIGGNGTGPGQVDAKKIRDLTENWGKLPPKERASALADLTRDMPPSFREAIESYFKKIGETPDSAK